MSDRLFIFDTTLRDGEQVPGCQLNTVEKIQVAKQLERTRTAMDALLKLQQLLKMQEEPIKILGAVGSHFRRLSVARTLLDHGRNAEELRRLYPNLQDFAARKTMEAARQFKPEFCAKAAQLILADMTLEKRSELIWIRASEEATRTE